jgi:hypothetical protein
LSILWSIWGDDLLEWIGLGADPRKREYECKPGCAARDGIEGQEQVKKFTLAQIEDATGCAGEKECADEAYEYCNSGASAIVHEDTEIEHCYDCATKFITPDGEEITAGEATKEDFMNMQYQCSGGECSEHQGEIIKAREVMRSYDCLQYADG